MPSTEDPLIGLIIAERVLSAATSESDVHNLVIRMAAPERQVGGSYFCHWEITAPGYSTVRYAAGIDGFQAIHLATKIIGVTLELIAKEKGCRLTWEGSDDLGTC